MLKLEMLTYVLNPNLLTLEVLLLLLMQNVFLPRRNYVHCSYLKCLFILTSVAIGHIHCTKLLDFTTNLHIKNLIRVANGF